MNFDDGTYVNLDQEEEFYRVRPRMPKDARQGAEDGYTEEVGSSNVIMKGLGKMMKTSQVDLMKLAQIERSKRLREKELLAMEPTEFMKRLQED